MSNHPPKRKVFRVPLLFSEGDGIPKGLDLFGFFCDLQRNQEFTDGFKDVLCLP